MPTSKREMILTRDQDVDRRVESEAAELAVEYRLHPSPPQRTAPESPKILGEAFAVEWAFEEV